MAVLKHNRPVPVKDDLRLIHPIFRWLISVRNETCGRRSWGFRLKRCYCTYFMHRSMRSTKRFLLEISWNIAPSRMDASMTAVIPTPSTRYQQDRPRRVMLESIMSSEMRTYAWSPFDMSETRSGGGRGKENSMVQPRTVALKVFRMSMLTILRLEDSDRGDDAQTTIKFSSWDVVAHTLCWTVIRMPA